MFGAGFMGLCHANAFRSVGGLFELPVDVELAHLADIDDATAALNAQKLGFSRSTGDWRKITADPDVDIGEMRQFHVHWQFEEPAARVAPSPRRHCPARSRLGRRWRYQHQPVGQYLKCAPRAAASSHNLLNN